MPSPLPLDSNVYKEKQRKVKQKIIDQNHFVILCIKLCDSLWLKKQFINQRAQRKATEGIQRITELSPK